MKPRYRLEITMCSIIIRLWDCKINKTWSEVSILRRICQVMRIWIYGLFYSHRFKDKWFVFAKQSIFPSRSCTKPIIVWCSLSWILSWWIAGKLGYLVFPIRFFIEILYRMNYNFFWENQRTIKALSSSSTYCLFCYQANVWKGKLQCAIFKRNLINIPNKV